MIEVEDLFELREEKAEQLKEILNSKISSVDFRNLKAQERKDFIVQELLQIPQLIWLNQNQDADFSFFTTSSDLKNFTFNIYYEGFNFLVYISMTNKKGKTFVKNIEIEDFYQVMEDKLFCLSEKVDAVRSILN